jgi:hypothetical protein
VAEIIYRNGYYSHFCIEGNTDFSLFLGWESNPPSADLSAEGGIQLPFNQLTTHQLTN